VEFLLEDRAAVWFLTIAYILFGLFFVQTDYTLNDEGLLTHYWASWARQDFLPVFFFQKVKPVLCALYLPFSPGGVHATLAAHVVVSSMSIPMIASTARALGQRLPNLPAIVLALSPIYFYGGGSGLSNIDGVVGVSLVLYLLSSRRWPLLAGVVAGLLPWVRFELAVFSLLIALYALTSERDRLALLGAAIFPLLYAAAGALYHHDPLWLAHFPPSAPFDPGNPFFRGQLIGLRYFLEPALALTPVAAAVAALRLARLGRIERVVLIYAVVATAAVNVLPIFRIGNFGASPRYLVHVLPALALLLGRAVEPWWEGEPLGVSRLVATLLLAVWMATRQTDQRVVVPFLVAYAVVVTIAQLRPGALAVMLVAAFAAAGPLLPVRFEIGRAITAPYLDPIVQWLRSHPAEATAPIYTNSQLLAPFLEARVRPARADISFVAGIDMVRELLLLTDPDNGQRERIRRLCATDLYGKTILGPITPDDVPVDSLLALRVESRLPLLFPDAVWAPRLEVLAESPQYRIARLRAAALRQSVPGPGTADEAKALLRSAIEAPRGRAALAQLDDLRMPAAVTRLGRGAIESDPEQPDVRSDEQRTTIARQPCIARESAYEPARPLRSGVHVDSHDLTARKVHNKEPSPCGIVGQRPNTYVQREDLLDAPRIVVEANHDPKIDEARVYFAVRRIDFASPWHPQ
jgi:hypothetical protein